MALSVEDVLIIWGCGRGNSVPFEGSSPSVSGSERLHRGNWGWGDPNSKQLGTLSLYPLHPMASWRGVVARVSGGAAGEALKEPAVVEGNLDGIRTEFQRVHLHWSQRCDFSPLWRLFVCWIPILRANVPMVSEGEKHSYPMQMPLGLELSLWLRSVHVLPGQERQDREEKGTNT